MLPINDLGSDSPLYFSLLGHPCTHELKHINRTVVTSALRFRGQSRCPQTNHRPCVSVETGTCTNHSTECCPAKCSPLASKSPREWIHIRQSVRQFQLHPDRQLVNRAAHRRADLRGKLNSLPREWGGFFVVACVVVESPHTVRKECTSGLSLSGSLFADNGASQIKGGAHDVSKQRSSKF